MHDVFHFINICPTIAIQVLNKYDFVDFAGDFLIIFENDISDMKGIIYVDTWYLY